jgi:hypothetical protein
MPATYDNVRLPARIERRAQGVRTYKTKVFEAVNGYEPSRMAVWDTARRSWTIQSIPSDYTELGLTRTDIEDTVALFEAAQGRLYAFLYKPKFDNSVLAGDGTIADGVYYKSYRSRTPGGVTVRTTLRAVVPDSDVIVAGSTWTGGFCVPVRWDTDDLEDEMYADDMTYVLPTLRFKEIKLV